MSRTLASGRAIFKATVQCEGCQQVFEAGGFVITSGYASGVGEKASERAKDDAAKDLQRKFDKFKESKLEGLQSNVPCPGCGYVQSWMIRENRRDKSAKGSKIFKILGYGVIFGSALMGAFAGGLSIMGAGIILGVLIVILPGINARMIYHPNKEWLKERGLTPSQAPAPRRPIELSQIIPK